MTCENCVVLSTLRSEFSEVKSDVKLLIRLVSLLLTGNNLQTADIPQSSNEPAANALQANPIYFASSEEEPGCDMARVDNEFVNVKIEEPPVSDDAAFAGESVEPVAADNNSKVFSFEAACSRYEADARSQLSFNPLCSSALPLPSSNYSHEPLVSANLRGSAPGSIPVVLETGEIVFDFPFKNDSLSPQRSEARAKKTSAAPNGPSVRAKQLERGHKTGNVVDSIEPKELAVLFNVTSEEFAAAKDPSFACKVCGRTYDLWRKFKDHRRTHLPKMAPVACPTCSREFGSKYHMRRHEAEAHLGITYACAFCSRAFKRTELRNKHELRCSARK